MTRRTVRNTLFLSATVVLVLWELVHALDGDPGTLPWTDYLIRLPWLVLVPAAVGFGVWLPLHLIAEKRRRE